MYRYSVEELVSIARNNSRFYKEMYKNLPDSNWELCDLPIIHFDNLSRYLNTESIYEVLTSIPKNGFLISSSATTGFPKMCTFSKKEWLMLTDTLGRKLYESKTLEDGDIIANLTMPGRMRTSFLLATFSHFLSPAECIDIPICGSEDTKYIVNTCINFQPNTLAGLTYTLTNVASYVLENNINLPIKKIFYGGELMYGAQRKLLKEAFPSARMVSYMYGTNEAGLIGYSDIGCEYNEHRVCDESCIMEIIDEKTLSLITEPYKEGILVVTNLTKIVLPIIRYMVGDRGMWLEPSGVKNRKFALCGRIQEDFITVAGYSLNTKKLNNLMNSMNNVLPFIRYQFQIIKECNIERIKLKIALKPRSNIHKERAKNKLLIRFSEMFPEMMTITTSQEQYKFDVMFVDLEEIITTDKSAKHKQILDLR
jgi:phenylacetate-CoA ligase